MPFYDYVPLFRAVKDNKDIKYFVTLRMRHQCEANSGARENCWESRVGHEVHLVSHKLPESWIFISSVKKLRAYRATYCLLKPLLVPVSFQ